MFFWQRWLVLSFPYFIHTLIFLCSLLIFLWLQNGLSGFSETFLITPTSRDIGTGWDFPCMRKLFVWKVIENLKIRKNWWNWPTLYFKGCICDMNFHQVTPIKLSRHNWSLSVCVSVRQFGIFLRNSLLIFSEIWHDG